MLVLPWTGASVSEEDWHWAVGIWEGEGNLGVYEHGGKIRAQWAITSTDRDMLVECVASFDMGIVREVKRKRLASHKLAWRLTESRRPAIEGWCRVAIPYIRTARRRQQVRDTLAYLERIGPTSSRGNNCLASHGRAALQNSEILGLTSVQQSAIGSD